MTNEEREAIDLAIASTRDLREWIGHRLAMYELDLDDLVRHEPEQGAKAEEQRQIVREVNAKLIDALAELQKTLQEEKEDE